MELRQPCRGEEDGGEEPRGGDSLCKTLPLGCLSFSCSFIFLFIHLQLQPENFTDTIDVLSRV